MDEWIAPYRSALLNSEQVDPLVIARVVQGIHRVDERDLVLVRQLTKCDVTYLDSWQIDKAISADLTDAEIETAVSRNRKRYEVISRLLPEYLRALDVKSNFSLRYAIDRLNDLVHDFRLDTSDRGRRDKILNDRIRALKRTQTALEAAVNALAKASDDYELMHEFEGQVEAFYQIDLEIDTKAINASDPRFGKFDTLTDLLNLAVQSIKIIEIDISSDHPRQRQINYNMNKSDAVSLAYDLHRTCGGPRLVTTPGSQFSFLCSIIHEMATGEAEQSLAGAIIHFANSRERQEADEQDEENANDDEAYLSNDNFYALREGVRRAIEAADWYRSASDRPGLSVPTKLALLRRAARSLEEAEERQTKYGPFIIWSSHAPQAEREAWHREYERSQERLRQSRILLGECRRASRNLV